MGTSTLTYDEYPLRMLQQLNVFQVTNIVLKEQYLITGVVVILDPGSIPVNSLGEKQRVHLRDTFLQDRLDPIYVAYNM